MLLTNRIFPFRPFRLSFTWWNFNSRPRGTELLDATLSNEAMNHSGKVSGGYVVQDSWWFSSLCGLHLLRFPNHLSWRNIAQGVRAGGIWQNAGKLKEWNELIGLRVPHFCLVSELNYPLPPPKFNIAPEKWWLEDYFPIGKVTFQGANC